MDHSSNITFVGGEFSRLAFDERSLFEGNLVPEGTAVFGPVAEFRYFFGRYRFSVAPERISLEDAEEHLSEELMAAATIIGDKLQERGSHNVQAIGMNLSAVFAQAVDGPAGMDFCASFVDVDSLQGILGYEPRYSFARANVLRGGVQFDVRVEPHFQSNGANVFLHVNAHQNVSPKDSLSKVLAEATNIRTYMSELCLRVKDRFGG